MGTGIVKQHSDILCEHAGMLSLAGGIKVIESLTVAICVNGYVKILLPRC